MVLSGNPQWFVNGEKFTANPGDIIHHPPRATHSMVNFHNFNNFNILIIFLSKFQNLFWTWFEFVLNLLRICFNFALNLFRICFSGNLWQTPFSPLDENWWIRWCILVCRWKPSSSLWQLKSKAIWFFFPSEFLRNSKAFC